MHTSIDLPLDKAMDIHGDEWSDIVKNCGLNPSLLPGWLACMATAFGIFDKIQVFILKNGPVIEGIIPYFISHTKLSGIPIRKVELAGNIVSYHQELITTENHPVLLIKFIEHLDKNHKWDTIAIANMHSGGQTRKAIAETCSINKIPHTTYPGESSPYLRLDKDWKLLLASKQKKFRYKVNKREKVLLEDESLKVNWYTDSSNCSQLIEDIFRIEEASWKVDEDMAITERPTETEYYKLLIPYLANKGILYASVLTKDGKAIAYNLCYLFNSIIGQIKTSYDNQYQHISPGAIIIEDALRNAIQGGKLEFDFLGDVMPHKMAWTKNIRPHETLTLYNRNMKGKLLSSMVKTRRLIKKKLGSALSYRPA